jgi:TRAP transporter 4TM/12TM fusion protein
MLDETESTLEFQKRRKYPLLPVIIVVTALTMVVFHLLSNFMILQSTNRQLNMHLGFALILSFLAALEKGGRYRPLAFLFLVASILSIGYMHIFEPDLIMRIGRFNSLDVVVGIIIILVSYEASRLTFGFVIPAVGTFFLAYTFLGHHIPGLFHHPPVAVDRGLTFLVLGFDGLYGTTLFSSLTIIFYFVLFGSVLQAAGAGAFFIEVGKLIGSKVRSGPALTSVISSSMVATITGTPGPNIILTGSVTIPLMKKAGFSPEVAGAVEAVASTGGQIMPPVMGAAAFIMANITGVPYAKIMMLSIIPALLYYVPLALGVQLYAIKRNIAGFLGGSADFSIIARQSVLFLVPFALIVYLLITGFSPMYAASWAILACMGLSLGRLLLHFFSKESPLTVAGLLEWCKKMGQGLVIGAILASQVAAICALLGTMINAVALTGMDIKLCSVVNLWSGGNLILALVMTALISMILGCGLPSVAAYLIVAITICPILTSMGVGLIEAHFFVFWCSIMGWMTPPVAPAPLIAAALAGAGFLRTSWQAIIFAAPGWFIPFMLVLSPSVMGLFRQGAIEAISSIGLAAAGLCSLTILTHRWYILRLSWIQIILAALVTVGMLGYFFTNHSLSMATMGLASLSILTVWQFLEKRYIGMRKRPSSFEKRIAKR